MEDFVNFSIAKKLKEKGFREPCLGWYYPFEVCGFDYKTSIVFNNSAYRGSNYKDMLVSHKDEKHIDAPTISQVLKWLREEKKYHIEFVGNACGYLFIISDIPSEGGTDRYCSDYSGPNDGGTWDKYEDCAIASIEYILDNLI